MAYIGPKPSQTLATPTSQYFNGTGSQTVFTLNRAVNVPEDLEVFVNNIQQEPGVGKSYTAIGTTLTFDVAPSSGTANVYVVYRGLAEVTTRLEHDPNAALAATTGTFSGAVTADGLTVDGAGVIRLNPSSGDDFLTLTQGGTQAVITADSTAGAGNLLFRTTSAGSDTDTMLLAANGDISFYEDTGTSAKFFWDASTERLGIGTVSPFDALHVEGTIRGNVSDASDENIRLTTSGGGGFVIEVDDATIANPNWSIRTFSSEPLTFDIGGSERIHLDSSRTTVTSASADPLVVQRNTAGNTAIQATDGTDTVYFGMPTGGGFAVDSDANLAAAPWFKIEAGTGRVGIGTSSPVSPLDVVGDIGYNGRLRPTDAGANGTAAAPGICVGFDYDTGFFRAGTNTIGVTTGATERLRISADGEVTKPYQPSFRVTKSGLQTLTVGTSTLITWETEVFDVGSNFATNRFTAPVTGKYFLHVVTRVDGIDTAASYYRVAITTSNRSAYYIIDPNYTADTNYQSLQISGVFDMDAGDTALVYVTQVSGTASHVDGSTTYTNFSGYLLG